MTDIDKILLTSALTVSGSVTVFVIGQLLTRTIIDPIHDLKKTIGEIGFALNFHAREIHTPVGNIENENKAQETLRKLSCDLRSKVRLVPLYPFWSLFSCCNLPKRNDAFSAARHLMGISNTVHDKDRTANSKKEDSIRNLLNLKSDD